jgi:hypothetical protein
MPRWMWYLPLFFLLLLLAVQGLRLGHSTINLSESDVVEHYVQRHAALRGVAMDQVSCSARPGEDLGIAAWLVLRCGPGTAFWEYRINRLGRLSREIAPGEGAGGFRPNT